MNQYYIITFRSSTPGEINTLLRGKCGPEATHGDDVIVNLSEDDYHALMPAMAESGWVLTEDDETTDVEAVRA